MRLESQSMSGDSPAIAKLRAKLCKLYKREAWLLAHPADSGWDQWESLIDQQGEIVEKIWSEQAKNDAEKKRCHVAEMKARERGANWPVSYGA